MIKENPVDEVIKKGLWIKNKLLKGRYQYSKLIYIKERLYVVILAPKVNIPILSIVEKMLSINKEIVVFYNNEYIDMIYKSEYDNFEEHFSKDEWLAIFNIDYESKLEDLGLVCKEPKFYVDVHETMEQYLTCNCDMETSEELCVHFNLK